MATTIKNNSLTTFFEDVKAELYSGLEPLLGKKDQIKANLFLDTLYIPVGKYKVGETLVIEYIPQIEKHKQETTLVYQYTYLVEKYDDIHSALNLKDFKAILN